MAVKQISFAALIGASLAESGLQLAQAKTSELATPVITAPSSGAAVPSPITVNFGLQLPGSDDIKTGHHPNLHAYLLIDTPTPSPGSSIAADTNHVAFPAGQFQLSLPLQAGQHQLQVVLLNHAGLVAKRVPASATVSITVN